MFRDKYGSTARLVNGRLTPYASQEEANGTAPKGKTESTTVDAEQGAKLERLGDAYEKLQTERDELKTRLAAVEQERGALMERARNAEREQGTLSERVRTAEQDLTAWKRTSSEVQAERDELAAEVQRLQAEAKTARVIPSDARDRLIAVKGIGAALADAALQALTK